MQVAAAHLSLVQTEIDDIFEQEFTKQTPYFGSVTNELLFMQEGSESNAEIEEEFAASGYFTEKSEAATNDPTEFDAANQVVYSHRTWSQSLPLSKELVDDAKFGVIGKFVQKMASAGRATQERNGMSVFRNAFSASYVGGDGKALCANDHELILTGETFDNRLDLELSEENLDTAVQHFLTLKDHNGVVHGLMPKVLLVHPSKFKLALEITQSERRSGTADNDMNYYSNVYPGLVVMQSPFLGAGFGDDGDNDDWFLLGEYHGIKRFTREALTQTLIPWEITDNDAYQYKARFRESYGWSSFLGIIGSRPA